MVRSTLKSEYRRIDPTGARTVLVDHGPRVLAAFSEGALSGRPSNGWRTWASRFGSGRASIHIDEDGVEMAGECIVSKTVIWTAGVAPSPAGKWLNVETHHAWRVRIQRDLQVPGQPAIFVVGDTASLDENGKPLPVWRRWRYSKGAARET